MSKKRAGAYKLSIREFIYIGSSWDVDKRAMTHRSDLRAGTHSCPGLQAAWTVYPEEMKCCLLRPLERKDGESDFEFRARLRVEEQELLDFYSTPSEHHVDYLVNTSLNARGPGKRSDMVSRWKDPEFRERMSEVHKKRGPVSEETRHKMRASKSRDRNPRRRPVKAFGPLGMVLDFSCAASAAAFAGVSQQAMSLWASGKMPQPCVNLSVARDYLWSWRFIFADEYDENSPSPAPSRTEKPYPHCSPRDMDAASYWPSHLRPEFQDFIMARFRDAESGKIDVESNVRRRKKVAKKIGKPKKQKITGETLRKLSKSKSGSKNPNSKRVWVDHHGRLEFDSVTAAARHLSISQQQLSLWLVKDRVPPTYRDRSVEVGFVGDE